MPIPERAPDRKRTPELERLSYQAEVIVQEAAGLLGGLSPEQFRWKPEAGGWSIAQVLSHLNVTNDLYLREFEAAIRRGRAESILAPGPFRYGFLGRFFLRLVEPPVRHKFKVPSRFQPEPQPDIQVLLAGWERGQRRFQELVEEADGLDLARVRVPSPVAAWLRIELGMMFWIKTGHDRRHLWQIRNVRNQPGFPGDGL